MSNENNLSVGLRVYVSASTPATFDAAGYGALSWTEVTEVESVPEFGGTAQVTEFTPVATGVVDKAKGSINYGETSLPIRRKLTDAGQLALQSGFDGANSALVHSFKFVHPQHGTLYITAVITGFTYNFSDSNSWYTGNVTLAVKTKPVTVDDVYTVNYVAGSNGSIIGVSSQLIVSGGNTTPVYAAPDAGYLFEAWSDAGTDNPRNDENVVADATYTASFVEDL